MNVQIWNAQDMTVAHGAYTTDPLKIINVDGYFSLQYTFTGAGTAAIKILSSNDGVNFVDCNTAIAAAATAPTGTAMATVTPIPSKWCKIQVTASSATLGAFTAWFYGVERVMA